MSSTPSSSASTRIAVSSAPTLEKRWSYRDEEKSRRREAPGEKGENRRPRELVRGLTAAPEDGREHDKSGCGDDRRRSHPEGPPEAESRHAFAGAFFVVFTTAFVLMKRSMRSCASSSRICFGGDFMR